MFLTCHNNDVFSRYLCSKNVRVIITISENYEVPYILLDAKSVNEAKG